jgi:hypothetical protein
MLSWCSMYVYTYTYTYTQTRTHTNTQDTNIYIWHIYIYTIHTYPVAISSCHPNTPERSHRMAFAPCLRSRGLAAPVQGYLEAPSGSLEIELDRGLPDLLKVTENCWMVKPLLKKQNGSVSVAIPASGMQHDGYFVSSYSLNLEVNLVSLPLGPLTPKSPKVIK